MATESSSSDLRIRQIIDEYISQKKSGAPESAEQFAANYPEFAEELLVELRRAEMFLDVWEQTDDSENTLKDSEDKRLRVICPECKSSIELEPETSWSSITCNSCNTNFSLVGTDEDLDLKSKQIGHFDLLERVGVGSFGTVWRAYDRELDRMAAIKMPRKGQLTPLESEHFLREARAAAQINHPNIVKVFEVGRVEDRVFIASEFVDGRSLAQTLTASDYTIRESAELVSKLASALQHAHQVGVVHRDLKPGNILIDKNGAPHIADFGLAKRDAGDITMTKTGAVMGTPAFMAPEQAKGLAHHSDARSDIYSLGVILYRMITGELPFRGSTAALLQQVINDDPPTPRKFNDKIPRDLETICLKCLEKQPDKRYSSAAELADEVQCFLDNKPIVSRPISFAERIWRWCKRKPALAGALALAFLIFVIGTVTSTILSIEAARESRNAAAALETANRRIYAADMNRVQQAVNRDNQTQAMGILRKYLPTDKQPDLRQIEWHYWWRKCNAGFLNQHQGNDRIHSVAISPDGKQIVWGDEQGLLYVSDAELRGVRQLSDRHQRRVTDISFSDDGEQFATSSHDGVVSIWSTRTMSVVERKNFGQKTKVWYVRFWSPDNLLAIGTEKEAKSSQGREIEVLFLDLNTGNQIDSFETNGFYPWVALSPQGTFAAIGDSAIGRRCTVRNVKKRENVWTKSPEKNFFGSSIFRNDGTELVVSYWDYSTKDREKFLVLDTRNGHIKEETIRRQGASGISQLTYSRDGLQLVLGTGKGGIDIYNAQSLKWIATLTGHTNRVSDVAVSARDNTIVSVSDDQSVRRWEFDLTPNPSRSKINESANTICFGGDDTTLFGATRRSLIQLVNPGRFLENHQHHSQHITYSLPDAALYFTQKAVEPQTNQSKFNLFKCTPTFDSPTHINSFERPFTTVDCLPNGDLVLCEYHTTQFSLDCPAMLAIYSISENKIVKQFGGESMEDTHHMSVSGWALSDDMKLLATCSRDRTVCVWDFESGRLKYSKKRPNTINPIYCIDISSTDIVASGEADGVIVLRDLSNGNELRQILAHDKGVSFVQFTDDGQTLISGSADSTIKIWDANSGQLRTELTGIDSPFTAFALSPAQTHLAASDEDGNVLIWNLSPADIK